MTEKDVCLHIGSLLSLPFVVASCKKQKVNLIFLIDATEVWEIRGKHQSNEQSL